MVNTLDKNVNESEMLDSLVQAITALEARISALEEAILNG